MRVISHVLRKIDDELPMLQQTLQSPAISTLVNDYNDIVILTRAMEDLTLLTVTGETYGQDFKLMLSRVPVLDLHRMLDRYLSHFAKCESGNATRERTQVPADDEDDEEEEVVSNDTSSKKEKRQFNRFLIKCAIAFALFVIFIAGGVTVAIVSHSYNVEAGVFSTILQTTAEVLKILFTTK